MSVNKNKIHIRVFDGGCSRFDFFLSVEWRVEFVAVDLKKNEKKIEI